MPAQKTAKVAAPKRATKARATMPANHTKTTRDVPATRATAKAPDGLLERVVEHAKELPTQVGHALETVGDIAAAAAKQTGTIVNDIAEKTGLHTMRKTTPKKTVSRSTRRSRRK